jgi:hypothetical protein
MVARINLGNSLFGALAYNQQKVDRREAKILYSNRIMQSYEGEYAMSLTMQSFEHYLRVNRKTENPIVHISLNPHPDDKLTDEQLSELAQEYLDKLGYGGQPYLVYKHEDIDRRHLHIVTTCVKEDGERMNSSFEHKRSKAITRELETKYNLLPAEKQKAGERLPLKPVDLKAGDVKRQVANIANSLMREYRFQSLTEYRALLHLYHVTVEEVKGEARGKPYNGLVYSALDKKGEKTGNPFKASLIGRSVGYEALQKKMASSKEALKDKAAYAGTKAIVSALLKNNPPRKQVEKELAKAGISVVFRENEDRRIYGVTFIDYNSKTVLNGSRLGKAFSANVFEELFSGQAKAGNHCILNEESFDNRNDCRQEVDSTVEALTGIFSMEQHGDNYEEMAFANRLKRKKKKTRGPRL